VDRSPSQLQSVSPPGGNGEGTPSHCSAPRQFCKSIKNKHSYLTEASWGQQLQENEPLFPQASSISDSTRYFGFANEAHLVSTLSTQTFLNG
jgi:hypothetical protein